MSTNVSNQPTPPAATANSPSSQPNKRTLLTVLLLIIAVLGIGTCVYIYHQNHKVTPKSGGPAHPYTYKQFTSYSLAGAGAGQGIAFDLPSSFLPPTLPASLKNVKPNPLQRGFIQRLGPKGKQYPVALAYVKSTAFARLLTSAEIASLNAAISGASSKNKQYTSTISGLKGAIKLVFPNTPINLSKPVAFTNSTIKSNAWLFSLDTKTIPGITQRQQGELIYITGNKSYYYFMITALSYNWTSNQSIWQQVNNSLKINQ